MWAVLLTIFTSKGCNEFHYGGTDAITINIVEKNNHAVEYII